MPWGNEYGLSAIFIRVPHEYRAKLFPTERNVTISFHAFCFPILQSLGKYATLLLALTNHLCERKFFMENTIIIGVVLVIVVLGLLRTKKHFKGGGCCGSGGSTVRSSKQLTGPKLGEIVLTVEGMHCENCQNRVEHAVNRLDGVVCRVNLKKKTATVAYSREVSSGQIQEVIEKLGYKVTNVQ